ncbi:MAG TPA: UDP-glucose--hexose-1-phosphate uridylyltransferase [Anaerolineales bacterium]|nr:UDP-glucose--hexose-1-phosphate uridylyltransferase [Anaerolineales bacterium]
METSSHRRLNPLTGEWVLVSPQRANRPWHGQVESVPLESLPEYDPDCYLCPRNQRVGGTRNPDYSSTFIFDNDFSSLLPAENFVQTVDHSLLTSSNESGICRVVCFTPRHDLTLPELALGEIENIINTWKQQTLELSAKDFVKYVQIFENKGAMMGCSNPHPHCQIWGTQYLSNEPAKELEYQTTYLSQHGRPLLADYLHEEQVRNKRILFSNDHFTVLVPYWAAWPFETMIIAHRKVAWLSELTLEEIGALAETLQRITSRYDNLFESSFPYAMGFHQAPFDGRSHPEWILHAHFYPPLLRSATVRKFMAGYELLVMPQRDITAEAAAERLRSISDLHYKLH